MSIRPVSPSSARSPSRFPIGCSTRGAEGCWRGFSPIGSAADGDDQRVAAAKSSKGASRGRSIGEGAGLHFPGAGLESDSYFAKPDSLDLRPDARRVSFGIASLGETSELDRVSRRIESKPGLVRGGTGDGRRTIQALAGLRLPTDRLKVLSRQKQRPSGFFAVEFRGGIFEGSGGGKPVPFGTFQDAELDEGMTGKRGVFRSNCHL